MISVIIPTFKNRSLFLQNLSHNLKILKDCEIIVVNDDPTESLQNEKFFNNNFRLIENKKNLGFGESVNLAVKMAKNTIILLLNDDVELDNGNFLKAVEYFKKDKTLFAVSFAQKEKDGSIVGKNIFSWKNGLFLHAKAGDRKIGLNAWAEGGASLIDKNKFMQLGGFDPIYSPFYWEDIDLSYRALKSNFQIVFSPEIIGNHYHETTIGKYYSRKFIKQTAYRNQLIFIWKNITDPLLFIQHLLFSISSKHCIRRQLRRHSDRVGSDLIYKNGGTD